MKSYFATIVLGLIPLSAAAQVAAPTLALSLSAALTSEPQARRELRFGRHIGVEAESPLADSQSAHGLQREFDRDPKSTTYGVAYLPVAPKADVFARVGYGSDRRFEPSSESGWRLGAGARYSPNPSNDIRADFTRQDFRSKRVKANIFSVGFLQRF